ncbi:MAG: LuxR C-terminal-related transcriptional regulator [Chloroflexota bacterium]
MPIYYLPAQTTPFIGRTGELKILIRLLSGSSTRLVTILAPGGMGKTRLALAVAELTSGQYNDGVCFVALAPLRAQNQIISAMANALDFRFVSDSRSPQQQLIDFLQAKHVLLVLDNFEHLLEGAELVAELLHSAPQIKVLATSRERLNLEGETVYVLSGMVYPQQNSGENIFTYAAAQMFIECAQRADPLFSAQDEASIGSICQLVQGMPLALELAAAWVKMLTPVEIAEEIARNVDFLQTTSRNVPERLRSVRAVFEATWNRLSDEEHQVVRRLSVFHGGCTREAAHTITGGGLSTLANLVDRALLWYKPENKRYEVHELLRQYAEEKLSQSTDFENTQDTYSSYYLNLLVQLTPKLKGDGQLEALNHIDLEFENIRAAWKWNLKQTHAALIEAAIEGLYLYLTFRNRTPDGEQLFGKARSVWNVEGDNPTLLAGKLLVRFPQGAPLEQYRKGLKIAERHQDAFEMAFCQRWIGYQLSHVQYDQDQGIPILNTSLARFQALDEKYYVAETLDWLGWSYLLAENIMQQVAVVNQCLTVRREIGDKIGTANALRNLGSTSGGYFDETERAFSCWEEAKRIGYEMSDHLGVAWNASLQGMNLILNGEFGQVAISLDEAELHTAYISDLVLIGFVRVVRGFVAGLRDEDYSSALRFLKEGYPSDSAPDFRLLMAPLLASVVACGLRDFQVLRPYLDLLFSSSNFVSLGIWLPSLLLYYLFELSAQERYSHAVELAHVFLSFLPPAFGEQPFLTAWAKHWELLGRLHTHLEAALGAVNYQVAWERGVHTSLEDVSRELIGYWKVQQSAMAVQWGDNLSSDTALLETILTEPAISPIRPQPKKITKQPLPESLSDRELEVLRLIAEGLSNPEIAQRLYLSVATVKVHTRNIYGKLGVNNRTQAVVEAQKLNLL